MTASWPWVEWRTVSGWFGGVSLCTPHKISVEPFLPDPSFRPVLAEDQLAERAMESGFPLNDLRALYGRRLGEKCAMCEQVCAEGNLCSHCGRDLHPRWPAVYCSDACAIADVDVGHEDEA